MPNYKSFKDDLYGKKLEYSDKFLELKGEAFVPNDSFSFNTYNALKDVNDFKTNNYSNLFLTKKQKNSDWLKSNTKHIDVNTGIVTTISFFNSEPQSKKNPGKFLYFAKNYQLFDINLKTVECEIVTNRPEKSYLNYIFYIDFVDENRCRISHTFGDIFFYLAVEDDKTVHFIRDIASYENQSDATNDKTLFVYNIDGQFIRLFKQTSRTIRNDEDEIIDVVDEIGVLGIDENKGQIVLLNDVENLGENSLIHITNNILDFDFYVNSSWVGYDRSQYIDSIDRSRSAFNLDGQALIHHQYNDDTNVNFIPLKNNLTYRGNTVRGDNFSFSSEKYPDVNFRTYNSINSGLNQEKGNDNIILTYTFHDQEYEINEGEDFFFTIPTADETNGIDPLFPYKYINIADTKFIKNGAFSSSTPAFSDKIKKMQGYRQSINGEVNNSQYLCTWLYKENEDSEPMWLDRWYYPDYISRSEALSNKIQFQPSFNNILDKNYLNDEKIPTEEANDNRKKVIQNTYFDKKSDMLIEAGNTYCYQRLSRQMVDEVIDSISNKKVTEYYDQNDNLVNPEETFKLNGENWVKVKYDQLHNTNQFNLNFDIYLDKNVKIGPQLFGNDYTNGFNIQNRKDLVPYLYYATSETIYMLNNKYEVQHQFNLSEKYDDRVLKIIQGDIYHDIVAISPLYIYLFSYDLRLKTRISLLVDDDKDGKPVDKAIKGISSLQVYEYDSQGQAVAKSLVNYPYGDDKIDCIVKPVIGDSYPFILKENVIEVTLEENNSIEVNKLLNQTQRNIAFMPNNLEYVTIPSRAAQILIENNSIIYNSNVYIPHNQQILKLIFCPDVKGEFTDEEREDYPAKIRVLEQDEYITNYPRLTTSASESETIATVDGNIEVKNEIKNIFINEDGKIYGLNFDAFSLANDGDTLYGLFSWEKYINTGGGWWLFNQSLSKIESDVSSSKYAEFQSMNSIDMIRFDSKGNMALVRNFNNLSDNTNSDNNKRIEIYSKDKRVISQYSLEDYQKVISLDSYNYINESGEEKTVTALLASRGNYVYVIKYYADTNKFEESFSGLPANVIEKLTETINSNALLRYGNKNIIYFNLYFPSKFLYPYIGTIKWDLKDLQTGWYNINVSIDLDRGEFIVKINDIVYGKITDSWFLPYVNSNGNLFANTYYIGCLGKQYGVTLNEITKNSLFDPYVCKGSQIENVSIYRKRLDYHEYQALRLSNQNINSLFLTVPCGIRNNIEEIVRYFKYNSPPSISNKIRINIAGTGLQTAGEFDLLKKEIMASINNNKDCLVEIEDVQFI